MSRLQTITSIVTREFKLHYVDDFKKEKLEDIDINDTITGIAQDIYITVENEVYHIGGELKYLEICYMEKVLEGLIEETIMVQLYGKNYLQDNKEVTEAKLKGEL